MDTKYKVTMAMFDVKPVDGSGSVDISKISNLQSVLNLGRRFRIGKTGVLSIKNKASSIKRPKPSIKYTIENPVEDLEKYLNEDLDLTVELVAIGAEIYREKNSKPRHKNSIKYQASSIMKESDRIYGIFNTKYENPDYEKILSEIKKPIHGEEVFTDEPKKIDAFSLGILTEPNLVNNSREPQEVVNSFSEKKWQTPKISQIRFLVVGFVILGLTLFGRYGLSIKNQLVIEGNSAVANLENAGENIKNMDFVSASSNFAQAYQEFSKAGDNMNFMGVGISSLLSDLPGAGRLKSAKNLIEAGKLIANAGQAMSDAMGELAKTNQILNIENVENQAFSIGTISTSLKKALTLSQKNLKNAKALLADVDDSSIPEDKKEIFEEFKLKLPLFEKLINDSVGYFKFLEDFIGTKGTKKYLILFQNPSELRPTGGFPGTYGVVSFKDGQLQDLKIDDVYNLDGQLQELIIPPIQLQHITPNWGMRDANWFINFPTSARKFTEFYKKESGQDIEGVITFSPAIVSEILKITGPIRMEKYGVTLNSENFSQAIQEEVEYKADRNQPKKILIDLAPLMLEKIYSADSEKWMEIFNIFVSSVDRKDILMYFRDLKLQDFSVTKGFSGQVNQTMDDYLMITLSNIKGSKTDSVIDSSLKIDTIFEEDDVRHRVVLTRTHNGGETKFGFFNKQSPAYVRVLVPDDAQFLGISGNSRPNFRPLLDYSKTDFKHDEDLVRFEEKSFYDEETGVTTYEESGKREYGFWIIINPGETKTIDLEYSVPFSGDSYQLYIQKQPGLEVDNLGLSFSGREIIKFMPELNKAGDGYFINSNLSKDINLSVLLK